MQRFGPRETHQRTARAWAFSDVEPHRAAKLNSLQSQFDDLTKRAKQMTRMGYTASGVALQERAFAVERQMWALENVA